MERDPRVNGDEESAEMDVEQDMEQSDSMNGSAPDADQQETGGMNDELETERQRSQEYLEQAKRARAELVNYRRRTEEELARMQKQAGERIISKLLPAIDDLDRAIDSMSETERSTSWGEGIMLVQRKIWSTLESEGVQPIEAVGQPFDPSMHEAISMQEGANGATTVIEEYQRGYLLGDRVLRPAMVAVGSPENAPQPANAGDETDETDGNTENE